MNYINSFMSKKEINSIGFKSIGKNVMISKKVSIYSPQNISIGDNVRIDDFTIISGTSGYIKIQNHIHIASYCNLVGGGGIELDSFSGLSSRVSLYSLSNDYDGDFLIGPTIKSDYTKHDKGPIILKKYVTIGTNSVVMPNIKIQEGAVLGAFSMAKKNIDEWSIYFGVPAKKIKSRKKGLIKLAKKMSDEWIVQKHK